MKLSEFKDKIPLFVEALRTQLHKRSPNIQVIYKETNPSNLWVVTVVEGYYRESYLIWTGDKGAMWCKYH